MPEQLSDDVINKLKRSVRRWKIVAFAAIAALVLAITGWAGTGVVHMRLADQERARAEDARRAAEEAHAQAERMLYIRDVELAHEAMKGKRSDGEKP